MSDSARATRPSVDDAGGTGLNAGKTAPHVVIVGGGFGGLATAKALKNAHVRIALIDRTNHHLFQPLLYQVATALLLPGQIAAPIREILRKQTNVIVFMGEVTRVDKDRRCVYVDSFDRGAVQIPYDYLILAPGVQHGYFGRDEFARFAPGLKSLPDAVGIRNKMLAAFEQAETVEDSELHKRLMTFVIVGAGPTGVELAAAIAIFIDHTVESEFRRIHPRLTKVVLIEQAPRILSSFSPKLSAAAHKRLTRLGVDVRLGTRVEDIDAEGVVLSGAERIATRTVLWAAGVAPSPLGKSLSAETDRAGRVRVQPDLSVPRYPEIFVIGDAASLEQDGRPLPGVAQVAIQQGRYVGRLIERRLAGAAVVAPFRYFDKGNMAIVGNSFAVLQSGKLEMSGFLAWLGWLFVHLQFLARPGLRIAVLMQWIWLVFTGQRGSRLIVNPSSAEPPAAAHRRD
jgi:NADH dehydrogenase FAD-containing subunit